MRRQRFYVGADDALGGNVQQIADEDAGQLPLGAGNHINLEVVGLQILHHLDHRQVKRLAPFQRSQPLHRRFHEPLRIRFVVGVRGAGKDRGLMRRALAQDVARVPVFQPLFEAERKLLVLFGRRIVRIVQRALEEEHMVEVEGRRLAEEGAVHIKDRDAVGDRDEILACLVRHVFDKGNEGLFRKGIFRPIVKVAACRRLHFRDFRPRRRLGARRHARQAARADHRRHQRGIQLVSFHIQTLL